MSKKASPEKSRRSSLKRTRSHRQDSNNEEAESPTSKRFHTSPDNDADLSSIVTEYSDTEEELAKLFQEKSPASKLSNSFKYVGLKESNLLKKPKVSSLGRRFIGLSSEERERKRRLNRSLDYPSGKTENPRQRRSGSWSPNK